MTFEKIIKKASIENHKRNRYTTNYPFSKQAEGISLLDNTNKSWK